MASVALYERHRQRCRGQQHLGRVCDHLATTMPITENIELPSYDELDVQDVNISQSLLVASGTYFGKYCDEQSKEYMLCKLEEKDPRKCLNEGKAVTMCGHEFFRKVGQACKHETERMAKCMEFTQCELRFWNCGKERLAMQQCFEEKMGMSKPPLGFFSQLRLHETKRPKPKSFATEFKEPARGVPPGFNQKVDEKLGEKGPSTALGY